MELAIISNLGLMLAVTTASLTYKVLSGFFQYGLHAKEEAHSLRIFSENSIALLHDLAIAWYMTGGALCVVALFIVAQSVLIGKASMQPEKTRFNITGTKFEEEMDNAWEKHAESWVRHWMLYAPAVPVMLLFIYAIFFLKFN